MATTEELYFNSIGREIERIEIDVAALAPALRDRETADDVVGVVRRIERAARTLQRQLDQQSASLWVLFQDSARSSQARMIQGRIESTFDRILELLRRGSLAPSHDTLANKVREIQKLTRQLPGYASQQRGSLPDASYWMNAPGRTLESDPWTGLVVLTAVLIEFAQGVAARPGR